MHSGSARCIPPMSRAFAVVLACASSALATSATTSSKWHEATVATAGRNGAREAQRSCEGALAQASRTHQITSENDLVPNLSNFAQ